MHQCMTTLNFTGLQTEFFQKIQFVNQTVILLRLMWSCTSYKEVVNFKNIVKTKRYKFNLFFA